MDEHTKENWRKIKETLEASGKTDCMFYQRAVAILNGGNDPLNNFFNNGPRGD